MAAFQIRSVLVASDLKEGSDTVMESASALAAATGADLHAVHAIELPPLEYSSGRSLQNDIRSAEAALEEQAVRCAARGAPMRSRSATLLAPHRAIIERAAEVSADLIVFGPHQRFGGLGLLGTTADRVARRGIAPCLIVKRPLSLPLREVVAADDFSEYSDTALDHAVAMISLFGLRDIDDSAPELVAVHVVEPLHVMGEYFDGMNELGMALTERLREAQSRVGVSGSLATRAEIRWSDPIAETLAACSADADLLVMGTRGKGAVARAFIGSVASSAAQRATCPVLLVPQAHARFAKKTQPSPNELMRA